ncbi:MAG: DUF1282 family protein, partial [Acholeplasmataceae bacterium]|nr:DUF1282 family protein [Acholeplasmataceae bacterium]
MKKLFIVLLILTLFTFNIPSQASSLDTSVPYDTYTIGPKGRRILTQTAYNPAGRINYQVTLNAPEDLFIKEDLFYIADTGNKRIVKMNKQGQLLMEITHPDFSQPTGVFVDDALEIYVADKGSKLVFKFDEEGNYLDSFTKPTEPIFGEKSPYVPMKIAVGKRGNMYIVGEGSTSGIIQLNYTGEFLGFFGTNLAGTSFIQRLSKILNVNFAQNLPTSPSNVTIDEQGAVFTVSPTDAKRLKRFNIASVDTLDIQYTAENLVSVTVNNIENIYTLSSFGIITEYDSYGHMIFEFGGLDDGTNRRLGLFVNPVAITVDSESNVYVLDKGTLSVEYFERSEFTMVVHKGLESFKDGIYDIEQWHQVLKMNSMFALANSALGQAEYRLGNYEEALEYYELAYNQEGYSNAFWQIRYTFMQNYLGWVFLSLILFFTTKKVLKVVDGHYQIYQPIRKVKKQMDTYKVYREMKLLFGMFKHPIDTFYDLKHRNKSSYLTASIIYLIAIIMSVMSIYLTSFIFRVTDLERFNIVSHTFTISVLFMLFVFANYLISTLNDGEGWFKDVFIGFAYALAPFIMLTIPIILLSHVLTHYE